MNKKLILAEYIWLGPENKDQSPLSTWQRPRSKTCVLFADEVLPPLVDNIPEWRFDGSSTDQALGDASDLLLKPVRTAPDPLRDSPNILVLCEVLNPDGTPHSHNTRRRALESAGRYAAHEPLIGFEQEYTLFGANGQPLCIKSDGNLPFQFAQYCGVGMNRAYGRTFIEAHARACIKAGLSLAGVNAEVMGGQWEFQIGPRKGEQFPKDALDICDELWLARWLLYRLSEDFGIEVSLDPKPVETHNGAGCHTNFSTKVMRAEGGLKHIWNAVRKLEPRHMQHMAVYGDGNDRRLTGHHETAHYDRFTSGVADRGASVRIGADVEAADRGYFEVRSPAANCDPYLVLTALLETVCGKGFKPRA